MDNATAFYNSWAEQQLQNDKRSVVLKWKVVNFLNLLLRNHFTHFDRVCEIGGAEGILLDTLGKVISTKNLVNFDISTTFCTTGQINYPDIEFRNYDFFAKPESFDLMLLSDITEHVNDDDLFVNTVSAHCKYLVIKIPVEICLVNSTLFHWLRLKSKPAHIRYGAAHINGHLRGYTIKKARKLVAKYFTIIDDEVSDVAYFSPNTKKNMVKRIFGKRIFIMIFGGAYFALARSKNAHNAA
jgi:hypothetical protein